MAGRTWEFRNIRQSKDENQEDEAERVEADGEKWIRSKSGIMTICWDAGKFELILNRFEIFLYESRLHTSAVYRMD